MNHIYEILTNPSNFELMSNLVNEMAERQGVEPEDIQLSKVPFGDNQFLNNEAVRMRYRKDGVCFEHTMSIFTQKGYETHRALPPVETDKAIEQAIDRAKEHGELQENIVEMMADMFRQIKAIDAVPDDVAMLFDYRDYILKMDYVLSNEGHLNYQQLTMDLSKCADYLQNEYLEEMSEAA